MFNDLTPFFDPDNGMDVAVCRIDGVDHNGYLNGVVSEFYLDNSGPAIERYTFEVAAFTGWRSTVGKTVTIDSDDYKIEGIDNDGTGVLTLNLYAL